MGSRVKEEERNERAIRGLLKLPGNRRCINCNSMGPQYVCTSFSIFICINCSGIHREFTHRVKSISMAKFTSQEVSALQEGGNERAKEIYFKNWDFQGQPVPDSSDVDGLRNFIKNVYVVRRYTGERIGDHPPQVKGSREDSYGNNNMDSSRGVLRSPYGGASEDNHGPQRSTESTSEDQSNFNRHPVAGRIDQTNRSTTGRENASFRNHQHPDELWKTGGMSENIQKDVTTSVSSVVEPSRVVLPIKLPDPPRSHKATTSTTSTEAQKAAPPRAGDPGSETSRDVKLDMSKSLIDFDSDMEPHQGGVQTKMQNSSLPSVDVGWATFDVATPKNATTMPSISSTNSSEGPLLQLPNSVSAPQSSFPTMQTAKSLSFPQANHGGQQHQLYLSPVDNIQSNNPPLNRASSAPVNSQLWGAASHAPIQGNSALPSNQGSNILIGARDPVIVSVSQQPVAEVTSSGRKALPEDIFTMSYHPVYASTWDWRANPQVNMGYGQYGMQYPVGSVNFPSSASMQGVSPDMGSMTLLPRAPSMGSIGSVLSPPQVQPSLTAKSSVLYSLFYSYLELKFNCIVIVIYTLIADQYMVQQHAVSMPYQAQNNNFPIGYQAVRGIATTGSAYGLSSMDKRMAAQNLRGMAQSSLPQVGGNPFA